MPAGFQRRQPRPDGTSVNIKGLKEFRRELRKLEDSDHWRAELKKVHYDVAELVAKEARARASSLDALARKSAQSLTAAKTEGKAAVRLGGAKFPYALGSEFGAHQDRARRGPKRGAYTGLNQFKVWRGNSYPSTWIDDDGAGYWLWPAIRELRAEVIDLYMDRVMKLSHDAFPD